MSVCNWRQRENLWADICSWFLVIINQVSFSAGVLPHSSHSLLSVFLYILHTLSFSSSSPSHFLKPVETQGLGVQSSSKTLDSASLFGWPHKLSCESSFLAKALVGETGRSVKTRDLLCDYQRVEVDGDNEVWTGRSWGEHSLAKPKAACVEPNFCWLHLSPPYMAELIVKVCHWAISLHINFLSSHSFNTRFRAQ